MKSKLLKGVCLTAAALMAAAGVATPANAEVFDVDILCTSSPAFTDSVAFEPGLTTELDDQTLTITDVALFCFSPRGTKPNYVQATLNASGTGLVDCEGSLDYDGTATFDWSHRDDDTTVDYDGDIQATGLAAPNFASGTAAGGGLGLYSMELSFLPNGHANGTCDGGGVTSADGEFLVTFRLL